MCVLVLSTTFVRNIFRSDKYLASYTRNYFTNACQVHVVFVTISASIGTLGWDSHSGDYEQYNNLSCSSDKYWRFGRDTQPSFHSRKFSRSRRHGKSDLLLLVFRLTSFSPWRRRQYIPLKHQAFSELHSIISQKKGQLITSAVWISNSIWIGVSSLGKN
jgi:hypothetical protein